MIQRKRSLYFLLLFVTLTALTGCSPVDCDTAQDECLRVLFIGNSYTQVNDLPGTFSKLAQSGNRFVEVDMLANGGWTLADHVNSPELSSTLNSTQWDVVIVQEQSQIPSVPEARQASMYPAARTLIGEVRASGAKPFFFITWAHRDGFPENGMPTYGSMQQRINQGYIGIAQELNVLIAPVGNAWTYVLTQYPEIELWQADGSHPTPEGTYLAACVFYAALFNESPQGLSDLGMVSAETAHQLQDAAARIILNIQ